MKDQNAKQDGPVTATTYASLSDDITQIQRKAEDDVKDARRMMEEHIDSYSIPVPMLRMLAEQHRVSSSNLMSMVREAVTMIENGEAK